MSLIRKIPGDFRSDMVSDEELMAFLQQKVAEKYPQGEVEASKHLVGNGTDFQIRTSPAALGTYNAVSCAVQVWRKKDGKMAVQVNVGDSDGTDMVQMAMALFNGRKRGGLVDEVADWLVPFLQAKQNQPAHLTQESVVASPSDGSFRKCGSCGAEVPLAESVCPYCGNGISEQTGAEAAPAISTQPINGQQPAGQDSAKSKNTFVLLGVLLGGFGVHNFYAGYTAKAVIQLLITVLSAFSLSAISWIWAIIEVCTVKQDAKGVPFA